MDSIDKINKDKEIEESIKDNKNLSEYDKEFIKTFGLKEINYYINIKRKGDYI